MSHSSHYFIIPPWSSPSSRPLDVLVLHPIPTVSHFTLPPRLHHHNTNTHTPSYSFAHHPRSIHCLSVYLFCRYTYYFTFKHKSCMNISNLPSDLPDLPSDLPDLPSDLPTHNCHYCLHIQSIRRINQHYAELTFSLLPVMFHHHRYTVLLTFICNRTLTQHSQPPLCRIILFLLSVMLHPHRYTVLLILVWNCSLTHQSQPTLCRTIFFLLPVILHHHRYTILFLPVTHMFCYSRRDVVPTPRVHLYPGVHSFDLYLHRYTTSVTVLYPVLNTNYSVLPASWLFPSIPEGSRASTPIVIPRTTPRRLSWLPTSATITLSVLRYQSSSLSQPTQIHNINSLLFALSTFLILVYSPNPHQYIHIDSRDKYPPSPPLSTYLSMYIYVYTHM